MKAWWKKTTPASGAPSVEDLVQQASSGKLSRRGFIAALSAMGASATAVATFVAVSRQMGGNPASAASQTPAEQRNVQLHNQHLSQRQTAPTPTPGPNSSVSPQTEAYVDRLLSDYHPDAIVEDVLAGAPAIGHAAIRARKLDEALGMQGLHIEVVSRFAHGDQVVAEWVATGTHTGPFLGYPASGQTFNMRGMTVVTRRDGLIVKESLYYDLNEARRQLKI